MSHITAMLIVLTLTGSPVTSAVCAAVCGHGTTPAAHCHESMSDSADPAIATDIACGTLSSEAPYVKEDISAPRVLVAVSTVHVAPLDVVTLVRHAPTASLPGEWLKSPLVLRI